MKRQETKLLFFTGSIIIYKKEKTRESLETLLALILKCSAKLLDQYANTDYIPIYLQQLENSIFHNNKTWNFLGI